MALSIIHIELLHSRSGIVLVKELTRVPLVIVESDNGDIDLSQ